MQGKGGVFCRRQRGLAKMQIRILGDTTRYVSSVHGQKSTYIQYLVAARTIKKQKTRLRNQHDYHMRERKHSRDDYW